MIIFDGKYNWSGKKKRDLRPVHWWPGSYRLTIVDLSKSIPGVKMIRPIVIIASDTGSGFSAKNYFENLAKNICRDFKIDMSKILWVEYHPLEPVEIEVAMFKNIAGIEPEIIYSVQWRPVMANELEVIKKFLKKNTHKSLFERFDNIKK